MPHDARCAPELEAWNIHLSSPMTGFETGLEPS
jgi:hypothetical protein